MDEDIKSEPTEDKPVPEMSSALVQTADLDLNTTPPKTSDDSLPSTPSRSEAGSRGSSEKGTPSGKVRRESGGSAKLGLGESFETASTCSSTSSTTKGKFPYRPGIQWKKNERVEAMDFMKKWYPAKIAEVDEEEAEVLIHFEGWNQRYDEWLPMTSDKLRPKMRHSERKEKRKKLESEYKVGEHVYAKWTDCKMYPGKITNILSDGSFEIVFYDGFKKLVQPINIRPMPQEAHKQKVEIVHVLPKEARKRSLSNESKDEKGKTRPARSTSPKERRSRVDVKEASKLDKDVKVIDGTTVVVTTESTGGVDKTTPTSSEKAGTSTKSRETTPSKPKKPEMITERKKSGEKSKVVKSENSKENSGKTVPSRDKTKHLPSKEKSRAISSKSRTSLFPKTKKLIVAPSFFVKKEKSESVSMPVSLIKEENIEVDVGKDEIIDTESIKFADTGNIQTVSMVSLSATVSTANPCPDLKLKETEEVKTDSIPLNLSKGDNSLSTNCVIDIKHKKAKKRTVSPSASETSYSSESQSEDGSSARRRSHSTEKERGATYAIVSGPPPKAFVIEQDHNQYKCMFKGCNKGFRKESLLDYHIKYYHTENKREQFPGPIPKRRKTSSICSTDSDISTSSKQRSASGGALMGVDAATRKQRHVSADSVLTSTSICQDVTVDMGSPVKIMADTNVVEISDTAIHERTPSQDTVATEESLEVEAEDALSRDEVVNCICGYNEENGLMIQCDVCLCWQHATCFDITNETLPAKYVCFVCENPPGVRDSCRYSHDQDWLKLGQPAQFSFLHNPEDENKTLTMQATNNLIADIHNINSVLHGLRQKIKAVKNKDHPEYKLWKKNWDTEETISLQDETEDQISLHEEDVQFVKPDDKFLVAMETSDTSVAMETDVVDTEMKVDSNEKMEPTVTSDIPEESETSNVLQDSFTENTTKSVSKNGDMSSIPKCESSTSIATESTLTAVDETSQFSLDTEPPSVGEDIQVETNSSSNIIHFDVEKPLNDEITEKPIDISDMMIPQGDPYVNCEKNLLEHILRIQSEIDSRLDFIDEQVILLESAESTRGNNQPQDILADLPSLKKSLHILENDLIRVKRLSAYHR